MTDRINGIKLHLEKLSDSELMGAIDHSTERMYHAENDLNKLLGHAAARGLVAQPEPAEVISLDDYRQGRLFDIPDGAA